MAVEEEGQRLAEKVETEQASEVETVRWRLCVGNVAGRPASRR